MPPKELTIPQRVVVRKALTAALYLCDQVANTDDTTLGGEILKVTGARPVTSRLEGIRRDFAKVKEALASTPLHQILFNPDDEDFAEVHPDRPYHITLGQAFFSASHSGLDSRAGTLIHEATHWKIVRGTDDHAYEGFERLSMTLARNNAQSLERIAEAIGEKEGKDKKDK